MSAITAIQAFNENKGNVGTGKIAASTIIYFGALLGRMTTGYLRPFLTGDFFAGHALETVDNSTGSAGDLSVRHRRGDYYATVPVFSSATVANIGDPVWAASSNHADLTLSDPGTTLTTTDLVGYIHNIEADGSVTIRFQPRKN
jgi:hypothetical protein